MDYRIRHSGALVEVAFLEVTDEANASESTKNILCLCRTFVINTGQPEVEIIVLPPTTQRNGLEGGHDSPVWRYSFCVPATNMPLPEEDLYTFQFSKDENNDISVFKLIPWKPKESRTEKLCV